MNPEFVYVSDLLVRYVEVFERMVEPDRAIQFRVAWIDDKGKQQVNRGFRVQFNQVLTRDPLSMTLKASGCLWTVSIGLRSFSNECRLWGGERRGLILNPVSSD